MMRLFHLSFVSRLVILFIFSLVSVQLLLVMGFFIQRGSDTSTGFRLPLPDQIAAIVELLEATPSSEHAALLRAVNGAHLHVRLEKNPAMPSPEEWRPSPLVERVLQRYLPALGGRDVVVLIQREDWRPLQKVMSYFSPALITIFVPLKQGDTVVLEAGGPLATAIFGFPPGFWGGFIGFAVAMLAIVIIRREVRPLRRLADAADRMDPGQPQPIADFPSSAPDIRAVISAFNRMQERIASLIKERMAMIGGFSHDVRTFATRLRLRVELIPDDTERSRAIRDIEDMIRLLDNALYAIQGRPAPEHLELVDVAALLREEIEDRKVGGLASIAIEPGNRKADVLGSAIALRRLFANLIENAIVYGGEARVSLKAENDLLIVTIEDNGPGIPSDCRGIVTQAFVRLESSRSRKTGGAGLGLAIAKNAADAHGGTMTIGDAPGKGTRITVELPLFQQRALQVFRPAAMRSR